MTGTTDFWTYLASAERDIANKDGLKDDLPKFENVPLTFFVHRSVVTDEGTGRRDQLWERGVKVVGDNPIRRLVNVYLDHFGRLGTFTNLILEAEALKTTSHCPVVLDLRSHTESPKFKQTSRALIITPSRNLLEKLGVGDERWMTILETLSHKNTASDGEKKSARIQARQLLRQLESEHSYHRVSVVDLWRAEGDFFKALMEYSSGPENLKLLRDESILDITRVWLRAIQATFLFRSIGTLWYTVPTPSPFASVCSETKGVTSPLSSWSALVKNPDSSLPNQLKTLANQRYIVAETRASAVSASLSGIGKDPNGPSGMGLDPERISALKMLASSLIGSDHEGHPLAFTFICCPDKEFLHWHETDDRGQRRRWGLRLKQQLSSEDFGGPTQILSSPHEHVSRIIRGNSPLLQRPGTLLWFSPIVASHDSLTIHQAQGIVEVIGDPMEAVDLPRVLTASMPQAIVIHIDNKRAVLYHHGQLKESANASKGDTWIEQENNRDLFSDLCEVIGITKEDDIAPRVKTVVAAAQQVAREKHGALFLLWKSSQCNNKITRLSLAWGWNSDENHLDLVEPAVLAAAASLDGETVVNLETGEYSVRQFAHPGGHQQFDLFDDTGQFDQTVLNIWANANLGDPVVELWNFGTRHHKALRVTSNVPGLTPTANMFAISVSSSGPIRIWSLGAPVRKYLE